jgi:hypothetical protein
MKTRIATWIAGACCLISIVAVAPAAHAADYQMKAAFRAGQIRQANLFYGDEARARQTVDLFIHSIHALYESDQGEPAWVIWSPDGSQYLVAAHEFGRLDAGSGFTFTGQTTEGPLVGANVTGAVLVGEDNTLTVVTRVETQEFGVVFSQPLTPLSLQAGGGAEN